ncbi:MAG: hypothetical protein L0Z70_15765 [Chloroflexi bacterium]|nr:hypothetical protein [Chloroflexota bacterium]
MSNTRKPSWISRGNIAFVVFILGTLAIASFQIVSNPTFFSPTGLPSPMISYSSKNEKISFLHPDSWVVLELSQGDHGDQQIIATFGRPGSSYPRVDIASMELVAPEPEALLQWGATRSARCQDFAKGEQTIVDAYGGTALRQQYECRQVNILTKRSVRVMCFDDYILVKTTAYQIKYCAKPEYWAEVEPVFDQISESFSLR